VSSPLKDLLEKEAGWEAFQMVVPHPFLPPRYLEKARNRNMIILLDQNMTLHVRWEGSRRHEHLPLTPRATRGLIREVLDRMAKYRRDLKAFSTFVEKNAEQPFDDVRAPDPVRWKKRELPNATKDPEVVAEIEINAEMEEAIQAEHLLEQGGESPMGEFYE
jgi:hypothetical protein